MCSLVDQRQQIVELYFVVIVRKWVKIRDVWNKLFYFGLISVRFLQKKMGFALE